MLDFSFSEILLCFVVALVVLGPERMPGVVRAVGRWTGKAKGYMRNLSAELERETQIGEMKRQLQDAQRILREQSHEVQDSVRANLKAVEHEIRPPGETPRSPTPALPSADSTPPAPSNPIPPASHGG